MEKSQNICEMCTQVSLSWDGFFYKFMEMKISQVKGICNLKNDRNAIEGPHLPPSVLHKGVTSILKSHSNLFKHLHFHEKFLQCTVN